MRRRVMQQAWQLPAVIRKQRGVLDRHQYGDREVQSVDTGWTKTKRARKLEHRRWYRPAQRNAFTPSCKKFLRGASFRSHGSASGLKQTSGTTVTAVKRSLEHPVADCVASERGAESGNNYRKQMRLVRAKQTRSSLRDTPHFEVTSL